MTNHIYSETQPAAPPETAPPRGSVSRSFGRWQTRSGKAKMGILMWLLGVPIPLILLFFLIRGCVS